MTEAPAAEPRDRVESCPSCGHSAYFWQIDGRCARCGQPASAQAPETQDQATSIADECSSSDAKGSGTSARHEILVALGVIAGLLVVGLVFYMILFIIVWSQVSG
jgi:ribosomal protein L37E